MKDKILGEVFPVKFLVHSTSGDSFHVLSASYELSNESGVEAEGNCMITEEDGKTYLSMTLEPKTHGRYKLQITFTIGEYTFKKRVEFGVRA